MMGVWGEVISGGRPRHCLQSKHLMKSPKGRGDWRALNSSLGTGSAASWCCEVVQGEPNHLWDSLSFILRKGSLEQ